jgi:hypothetical protein
VKLPVKRTKYLLITNPDFNDHDKNRQELANQQQQAASWAETTVDEGPQSLSGPRELHIDPRLMPPLTSYDGDTSISHAPTSRIAKPPSGSRGSDAIPATQFPRFIRRDGSSVTETSTLSRTASNSLLSPKSASLQRDESSTAVTTESSSPERAPLILLRISVCVCQEPEYASRCITGCTDDVCIRCMGHRLHGALITSLIRLPGVQHSLQGPHPSLYFMICPCNNGTPDFCRHCGGYPICNDLMLSLETNHEARLDLLD